MRLAVAVALAAATVAAAVTAPPVAAATTPTLTIAVAPAHLHVGDRPTISGDLSGADVDNGQTISVTRTAGGSEQTACVTATGSSADGHFSCVDSQPVAWGDVTYTASWAGDVVDDAGPYTATATTHVARNTPRLTLTVSRRFVPSGARIHLTATLHRAHGRAYDDGTVTIYARPYRHHRKAVADGDADTADGSTNGVTATVQVDRRTAFLAVFGGDDTYRSVAASRPVRVRAVVGETLRRGYATHRGVTLYHQDVNPALIAKLAPAHKGDCLFFRAQRHYTGSWHTTAVSDCVHTDRAGLALGVLRGSHVSGEPYRLRAEWRGSTAAARRSGRWLELRFRH